MSHTPCWCRPAGTGPPLFAAGRLSRVVHVAALLPAAGSLHRAQQQPPLDQGRSRKRVALTQRPVLEHPPQVEHVPWNRQTEHELFHFWTTREVLLDELLWQTPAQVTEQKALRAKLRRWAAACARHRDVAFLEWYMGCWDAAAAATGSPVDVNKLALARRDIVEQQLDPWRLLRNVALVGACFAEAGIEYHVFRAPTLLLGCAETVATRLPRLLESLQSILGADAAAALVEAQPSMLTWRNRNGPRDRIAALQQLHPDFGVVAAACRAPQLLCVSPELLAARWHGIRAAGRLRNEEMVALANYDPSALCAKLEVVQWKLALYHMYEQQRAARQQDVGAPGASAGTGLRSHERPLSFPSWMTNTIKCGGVRFQRLDYLLSVGVLDKRAYTVVRETDAAFLQRHPDFMTFLQWPGPGSLGATDGSDGNLGRRGETEDVPFGAEQPSVLPAAVDVKLATLSS